MSKNGKQIIEDITQNAKINKLVLSDVSASDLIKNQDHEEELWCAHEYLNKMNVPYKDSYGKLSIVGRIKAYQKMTFEDGNLR